MFDKRTEITVIEEEEKKKEEEKTENFQSSCCITCLVKKYFPRDIEATLKKNASRILAEAKSFRNDQPTR